MNTFIYSKRKAAGMSQEEVAKMLGISRPTYIKLERGEAQPDERQIILLSQILGISSDALTAPEVAVSKNDILIKNVPKEDLKKFEQVLLYVVSKVGARPNIGQTALYKLLYFIDFDYYEKYQDFLVGATYIKNTHGPTPISFAKITKDLKDRGLLVPVKSKYFGYDQTRYIATNEPDVSSLSARELMHIDNELGRLASKSAKELSDLSHIDTPWRVASERDTLSYRHVFYRPEETSVADNND